MKNKEIIKDLKYTCYTFMFLFLLFAILFIVVLFENKNLNEKVQSALDLSRGYNNKWSSCQDELWDLKNTTYYERKGCAYPVSCFNNAEDYLAQFPNGEEPSVSCLYNIWCEQLNFTLNKE